MIRYFIPSDGDDPAHPNVFQLPSGLVGSGEVRCADVRRHFPLRGRYHFRFKKKFKNAFVWVDMTDDEAVVPACDGVFTAKITRLSDGREGGAPPPPSPPPHQHQQQQQQQQYIQGMAPSASASIRRPVNSGGLGGGADDLLNMEHLNSGARGGGGAGPIPGPGGMGEQPDDLLGMDVFYSTPAASGGSTSRAMPPHSPPMHPTPMVQIGAGSQGLRVGGIGVGTQGMGRPGSHRGAIGGAQWPQQFARFPPPGTSGL